MNDTPNKNLETVGTVTGPDGTVYEVDWLCNWDENGELNLNDRQDAVMLYDMDGNGVQEFCNPNWDEGGFRDVEHVLEMAAKFIRIGGLES